MFDDVVERVRGVVRELDPALMSASEALSLMRQFAELENLAAAGKAVLAVRVVETDVWRREGDRSPEHWLARTTGTYVGAARDLLETASRVSEVTGQAWRAGKLSTAQVSLISSAVAADPDAESALVEAAPAESVRELQRRAERVIAAKRSADVEREREDAIRRARSLRVIDRPDGSAELRARGNKVDIATLRARLQPWIDEQFASARGEDRHEPLEAYAFDALMAMGSAATSGNRQKSPAKVLIRVDLAAVRRGTTEPGEMCEIAGFGSIPVSEALKVMPEALLAIVLTDGKPVNVTHFGRKFTAHQQTALEWSGAECEVLGCYCTTRLEKDHHTGWRNTHESRADDGNRLCPFHHRLKTLGWYFEPGSGKRRLVPPERAPARLAS